MRWSFVGLEVAGNLHKNFTNERRSSQRNENVLAAVGFLLVSLVFVLVLESFLVSCPRSVDWITKGFLEPNGRNDQAFDKN
jgi:hypothetical protein